MNEQADSATIPSRPVIIEYGEHAAAERLLRSIFEPFPAEPGVEFALHMRLFADAVFGELPPPPTDRMMVQEALSLEVRDEIRAGEVVEVGGERSKLSAAYVLSLVARRQQAGAEPAALLKARLRLADPAIVSAQAVRKSGGPAVTSLTAMITAQHLAIYADLSGDANPIHTDLAFARSLGLRERVAHGSLLAFLIAPAIASAGIDGSLRRVQMRFLGPAFAGEPLQLITEPAAVIGPGRLRVRVLAIRPDRLVCSAADAEVAV